MLSIRFNLMALTIKKWYLNPGICHSGHPLDLASSDLDLVRVLGLFSSSQYSRNCEYDKEIVCGWPKLEHQ